MKPREISGHVIFEANTRHKDWQRTCHKFHKKHQNCQSHKSMKKSNRTSEDGGKVYLFFLVNGSGRFCGIAEMTAAVNFKSKLNIWNETSRWSGVFPITWVSTDSLPNRHFVQLRNPLNENKPITYSRDTQEVPFNIAFKFIAIYAKCDIYKRK